MSSAVTPYVEPFLNQLHHFCASGFDLREGDFVSSENIFALTYDLGHVVPWPVQTEPSGFEKLMLVPDQFASDTTPDAVVVEETTILGSSSEYNRSFGMDVNVEGTNKRGGMRFIGVEASVAARSKLFFSGGLFRNSTMSYALNFYVASVLRMNRQVLNPDAFSSVFREDVDALPEEVDSQEKLDAYLAFFVKYGTHYIDRGSFGGIMFMETGITNELFQAFERRTISQGISQKFNSLVTKGSLSIDQPNEDNDFVEQNQDFMSSSLGTKGGLYLGNMSLGSWFRSLYDGPTALLTVPGSSSAQSLFSPIWTLMTVLAPKKQELMNKAFDVYIQLGAEEAILSNERTTPLFTNGIDLLEKVQYKSNDLGVGFSVTRFSGTCDVRVKMNYSQIVGSASTMSANLNEAGMFTVPVPRNSLWRVQRFSDCESTSGFIRLNSALMDFGALGEVAPFSYSILRAQDLTFHQDGLVMVQASVEPDNDGLALLTVRDIIPGGEFAGISVASSPYSHMDSNSMFVPIRRNTPLTFIFLNNFSLFHNSGKPILQYRFLPLISDRFTLDTPIISGPTSLNAGFEPGVVYESVHDGFLVVYLISGDQYDFGAPGPRANIYVHSEQISVLSSHSEAYFGSITTGYTGEEWLEPDRTDFKGRISTTIPISLGSFFKVEFDASDYPGNCILSFHPLARISHKNIISGKTFNTGVTGQGFLLKTVGRYDSGENYSAVEINGIPKGFAYITPGNELDSASSFMLPLSADSIVKLVSTGAFGPTQGKLKQFPAGVVDIIDSFASIDLSPSSPTSFAAVEDGIINARLMCAGRDSLALLTITDDTTTDLVATVTIGQLADRAVARRSIAVPVLSGRSYTLLFTRSLDCSADFEFIALRSPNQRFQMMPPIDKMAATTFQALTPGFLVVTSSHNFHRGSSVSVYCHENQQYVIEKFQEAAHGGITFLIFTETATMTIPVLQGEYCQVDLDTDEVITQTGSVKFYELRDTFVTVGSFVFNPQGAPTIDGTDNIAKKKLGIVSGISISVAVVMIILGIVARKRFFRKRENEQRLVRVTTNHRELPALPDAEGQHMRF